MASNTLTLIYNYEVEKLKEYFLVKHTPVILFYLQL